MFQSNTYIEVIGSKAYVKEKGSNRTLGYWENNIFTPYNNSVIDIEYKIISEEIKEEVKPLIKEETIE